MQNSLTIPEQHLINLIPSLPPAKRILVAGNRSGELPLELIRRFPSSTIKVHVFDVHHARQISSRLSENGINPEEVVSCTPDVPTGPWDAAFFQTTPLSMPAELVLDQLQDIFLNLAQGAPLHAAFEGDADDSLRTLRQVFPSVKVPFRDKRSALFRAVHNGDIVKKRSFASVWPASVPGGERLSFTSLPGCFCHRRADPGGLALAETAARECAAATQARILDMGCGCGFVGLLVQRAIATATNSTPSLLFVDSHSRAIAAARINADSLGATASCTFTLSDAGIAPADAGTCSLALANPPYYGDWRIAEVFLHAAYNALSSGGICLSVAKNANALADIQADIFGSVEKIPRRGYTILKSRKP